MSLPNYPAGNPGGGPYRKPRADLYTMLLLIALVAIILATVCLYLDGKDYPGSPPYKDAPPVSLRLDPSGLGEGKGDGSLLPERPEGRVRQAFQPDVMDA